MQGSLPARRSYNSESYNLHLDSFLLIIYVNFSPKFSMWKKSNKQYLYLTTKDHVNNNKKLILSLLGYLSNVPSFVSTVVYV
jgi:hypothetical protein